MELSKNKLYSGKISEQFRNNPICENSRSVMEGEDRPEYTAQALAEIIPFLKKT